MEKISLLVTHIPKPEVGKKQEEPYTAELEGFIKKDEIVIIEPVYFSKKDQREKWYKLVEEYMNTTNTKPYCIAFKSGHKLHNVMLTNEELSRLIS